ncbi:hypothetical protein [Luteolibacter luteus]|uniref:Uncharacterized protein n=1 Tax=Luteolibacter luteus TaxID=2728835 RepID=A0A858RJN3_9BACT|nr:hypothetical protein [Luteolibacter luteus]QJE96925.1 hypothetical protein HHL09_14395 [Luteolibacter luteus]
MGFLLVGVTPALAFPPAPPYTLYGTVRDQVGQTISADGAVVILFKGSQELGRTPINSGARLDQNYELNVRIDQNRGGTSLYSEKALEAQGAFSMAVDIGGARYYPIEVAGTLTAGKGGERVRLDLTLGQDSDGDGLPDVWEQWQLYQAGKDPDENGNWPIGLIDKDGDLDGDGTSNWLEYLAGTFAGDATERFALDIKEKTASSVRFGFYAITGKTYTIETSTDAKTWTRIPFSVGQPVAGTQSWRAAEVGVVSAFSAAGSSTRQLYRLTVR